jgi:uncharacterized membrane protein YfcA
MSPLLISLLCLAMVGTAFLSGIFGMAGGMILIGVLLALLPVPEAMMLHGVTQMASNGWRALLWWRYVPSKPVALLLLGLTPFLARLAPASYRPNPDSVRQGTFYGAACMTLILLTGVSGPLIDTFFLGGKFDRREIVATKAMCQIFGHAAKLIYFGAVIEQAASVDPIVAALAVIASMIGTSLAAKVLLAMTDRVSLLGQPDYHRHRRILCRPRRGPDRAGRQITERPAGLTAAETDSRTPRLRYSCMTVW